MLSPAALEEIRQQERSLHPQPVIAEDMSYLVMQQAVLQEQEDERRGIGRVWGESLYDMQSREGWFREGAATSGWSPSGTKRRRPAVT